MTDFAIARLNDSSVIQDECGQWQFFLYATSPVSGIIGYVTIKEKFEEDEAIWQVKFATGRSITASRL
jgi:predicted transcriptional regulator